jgi:hypothetical protein
LLLEKESAMFAPQIYLRPMAFQLLGRRSGELFQKEREIDVRRRSDSR